MALPNVTTAPAVLEQAGRIGGQFQQSAQSSPYMEDGNRFKRLARRVLPDSQKLKSEATSANVIPQSTEPEAPRVDSHHTKSNNSQGSPLIGRCGSILSKNRKMQHPGARSGNFKEVRGVVFEMMPSPSSSLIRDSDMRRHRNDKVIHAALKVLDAPHGKNSEGQDLPSAPSKAATDSTAVSSSGHRRPNSPKASPLRNNKSSNGSSIQKSTSCILSACPVAKRNAETANRQPRRLMKMQPKSVIIVKAEKETCLSCGLASSQCLNTSSGPKRCDSSFPSLRVKIEDRDQARLRDFIRNETRHIAPDAAEGRSVNMSLVNRNGNFEKKVDVRVGLRLLAGIGEVPDVRVCQTKRANIIAEFCELMGVVKLNGAVLAYVVDGRGTMFGAMLLRE